MSISIDRLVIIMACLYDMHAEIVEENDTSGGYLCYSIVSEGYALMKLDFREVDCLEDNHIIECDGGSAERENEKRTYILTENANSRIAEIVRSKKSLF